MQFLYSLIITLISPFFFLRLLYRSGKAPAYRRRWGERVAYYGKPAKTGVVWFHAVSFGEAEAVFPLIQELQRRYSNLPVLVTSTTLTGSNRVRDILGNTVQHVYLPYDLPGIPNRFLRHFKPVLGIMVETEIWPNLYRACGSMNIPLAIVNARLSERSAWGYQKVPGLVARTLSQLFLIAAQEAHDARRFIDLGADRNIVSITGNLKFDYPVPDGMLEKGRELRRQLFGSRPVWIAASTHKGEEEPVLEAYKQVKKEITDLLLVLVPRRPERFDRVASLCKKRGFELCVRSSNRSCDSTTDIFLLDSMGELKQFYAAADVAYIGGSMVKTGGHNALEASALGLPVVFGPHMFNFQKIAASLVAAGASIQVKDRFGLAEEVEKLFVDKNYRQSIGVAGNSFVQKNRGALDKVIGLIRPRLDLMTQNQ